MATRTADAYPPEALEAFAENCRDERSARWLYAALADADADADPRRAALLGELADYEKRHADKWAKVLADAGRPEPKSGPSVEHRAFAALARLFGVGAILPLLHKSEV